MKRVPATVLTIAVYLSSTAPLSADPLVGKAFCASIGLVGRERANCATLDLWSLDFEDYVSLENAPPIESIKPLAAEGNPSAQFTLGYLLSITAVRDLGGATSLQLASEWYQKAAAQGHLCAQHNLGMMYLQGNGISQNTTAALRLIRGAAERGFGRSQRVLWKVLFFGHGGVEREYFSAVSWLRKAAMQGEPAAHSLYREVFRNRGWGTLFWKDDVFDDYHAAAQKGDAVAQYLVGELVGDMGYYVPSRQTRDNLKWYRLAAEQGVVEAQHEILVGLRRSRPSDDPEIAKWQGMFEGNANKNWLFNPPVYLERCLSDI